MSRQTCNYLQYRFFIFILCHVQALGKSGNSPHMKRSRQSRHGEAIWFKRDDRRFAIFMRTSCPECKCTCKCNQVDMVKLTERKDQWCPQAQHDICAAQVQNVHMTGWCCVTLKMSHAQLRSWIDLSTIQSCWIMLNHVVREWFAEVLIWPVLQLSKRVDFAILVLKSSQNSKLWWKLWWTECPS